MMFFVLLLLLYFVIIIISLLMFIIYITFIQKYINKSNQLNIILTIRPNNKLYQIFYYLQIIFITYSAIRTFII